MNGGICDQFTGNCDCAAGFMGPHCEEGKLLILLRAHIVHEKIIIFLLKVII